MSARIPSAYTRTLLQATEKVAPNEPDGDITVEQTSYFDLSNEEEFESVLVALLEDEDKREWLELGSGQNTVG